MEKFCPMLKNWSGPQVVTPVVWNKPDVENSVPLWIIILAILAGLLLLALLIYVLYKVSDVTFLSRTISCFQWSGPKRSDLRSAVVEGFFSSVVLPVGLLQEVGTVRHGHGKSPTQAAGDI